MKTLFALILLALSQIMFAQKSEPLQIDSIYRETTTEVYCTIRVIVSIDDNNNMTLAPATKDRPNPVWEWTANNKAQQVLAESSGKPMYFESVSEIINFMVEFDWQVVASNYVYTKNGTLINIILLKKNIPCLKTKNA